MTIVNDATDSGIPGGRMASRPVHFFWLLDCSSSMGVNGKIGQLNFAIREAIPEMKDAADSNPAASLLVRTLTFSHGARWLNTGFTNVKDFSWKDVASSGQTDMGAAFKLVAQELHMPPMPERALRPVLVLVSDGQPTDDWRSGLREIDATPWGQRAVRVAIAIGKDASVPMLKEFLANPEAEPIQAGNPKALAAAIRWVSTAVVKVASTPMGGGAQQAGNAQPAALLSQQWQAQAPQDTGADVW